MLLTSTELTKAVRKFKLKKMRGEADDALDAAQDTTQVCRLSDSVCQLQSQIADHRTAATKEKQHQKYIKISQELLTRAMNHGTPVTMAHLMKHPGGDSDMRIDNIDKATLRIQKKLAFRTVYNKLGQIPTTGAQICCAPRLQKGANKFSDTKQVKVKMTGTGTRILGGPHRHVPETDPVRCKRARFFLNDESEPTC